MGWRWPWQKSESNGIRPDASAQQANLEDLRNEVAMLRHLAKQLISQLAERDAQIRMVLEERYYRPVQPAPADQRPAVQDPAEFNDVTQFDSGSDEQWLKRQDAVLKSMKGDSGGEG